MASTGQLEDLTISYISMALMIGLITIAFYLRRSNHQTDANFKCDHCDRPLSRQCMECKKQICNNCGIMDKSAIGSCPSYICRNCLPLKCNECRRILIDENVWEHNIERCHGCNKAFCNNNLSEYCIQEIDTFGCMDEQIFKCRQCSEEGRNDTNMFTLGKYSKYLQDNDIESDECEFEEWIKMEKVKDKLMRLPSCMSPQAIRKINGMDVDAPIECNFCDSCMAERYFMLRIEMIMSDCITYQCIDCAAKNVQNSASI